ncbi:MAG: hypothetical protein R3Y47_00820 [Lachnospiraceae bacterium]
MNIDALKNYMPYVYMDEKEPFKPIAIGYHVYDETADSVSFKRSITVDKEVVDYVIEYAIYWDYDIQHMYDLEHVWIYVDYKGEVVDCEASFHGKILKSFKTDKSNRIDGHILLYCQPGKHAFSPYSEVFELLPDFISAASKTEKDGGLHTNPFVRGRTDTSDEIQEIANRALAYYKFVPSRKYKLTTLDEIALMKWEALYDKIPGYLEAEIKCFLQKEEACI